MQSRTAGLRSTVGRARSWRLRAPAAALVLALAIPTATGAAAADCQRWRRAFASMSQGQLRLESGRRTITVTARLAGTPEQQAAGFQCATQEEIEEISTAFHMQNVRAPLDIAFARADGRIFSILTMPPSTSAVYGPPTSFRWALEAPAGFFARHGIRHGEARLALAR